VAEVSAELSRSNAFPGVVTATIFYDDANGTVDRVEVLNESAKDALLVAHYRDQEVHRQTYGPGLHTLRPSDFGAQTFKFGKQGGLTDLGVAISV
jgi:hypothetical protein